MNVLELIDDLKKMPQDAEVVHRAMNDSDCSFDEPIFSVNLVNGQVYLNKDA